MKNISTNKLQTELSKVIHEVEKGEIYEVHRYAKPVAYLVPEKEYGRLIEGKGCKGCVEEIKRLLNKK
jgi:prevent-host-death family protein